MLFLRSILLAAACLTLSVSAAPVSISASSANLSARAVDAPTLVRRALTKQQLSPMIVAVQKAQAKKQLQKAEKKKSNTKIMNAAPKLRASEEKTKGKTSAERKKQAKADRTAKWVAAKGQPGPARGPGKNRVNADHRKEVSSAMKDAANRMSKNTVNVPNRKDTFAVGGHTSTGKDARKAIMNSYLHGPVPVGRGDNHLPKDFRNDPYSATHGDASLRGQRPINNPSGAKLNEYASTGHGQGWIGSGAVGPHRTITSNTGGTDTFHGVIGHDKSRGGDKNDHYLATHTVV